MPLDHGLTRFGDHILPVFGFRGACAVLACLNEKFEQFNNLISLIVDTWQNIGKHIIRAHFGTELFGERPA